MANTSSSAAGSASKDHSYDAIVIGTGITGGWAAKELTEKGLKTLVLDRGRDVKHGDYPTATKDIWEFPYGGRATDEALVRRRHRASVHRGPSLRLDPRLSRRRPLDHVGPAELPLERPRLRRQREGWH